MENEFEIWLLSYRTDLVTGDLDGLKSSVGAGNSISSGLVAEGVSTIPLPSAEIYAALQAGVVDSSALATPDALVPLFLTDTNLVLYRFSATANGVVDRAVVSRDSSFGTSGDDFLQGTLGDDALFGLDGDDSIQAEIGADTINGGPGDDVAAFGFDSDEYTVGIHQGFLTVTQRITPNLISIISDVETLDFTDTGLSGDFDVVRFGGLGTLTGPELAQFIELYIAYFNRAPDALGLGFWGTAHANGTSLEQTAALFIDQDETRATYPDTLSNTEFAIAVYGNVLGRVPDQAGFDFWVGKLNGGSVNRDQFILEVLRGAKAAPPAGADQAFIDQQQADQKYLSDKTDLGTYFAVTLGMSDVADASAAMAIFDGTEEKLQAAVQAIDGFHAAALDPINGAFLMPLNGVLDNPFAAPTGPGLPTLEILADGFSITEDSMVEFNVLANDTGAGLHITGFTNPANGTLELVQTLGGRLLYTPSADFVGADSFTYTAADGFGQQGTVTVTVNVTEDDVSGNIQSPTPIGADGRVVSELEDGFDADFFSVDLSDFGSNTLSISLTGPSAAEAWFFIREPGSDAYALSGDDDSLFYAIDSGMTSLIIGVERDPNAADIPGEDAYTLDVGAIFPPDDLQDNSLTPVHVNLSGDGTWSTDDSTLSALASIETVGDADWFGFVTKSSTSYRIQVAATDPGSQMDIDVRVRDASGTAIGQGVVSGDEDFQFFSATGGLAQHYIEVFAYSGGVELVGNYNLTVTEII